VSLPNPTWTIADLISSYRGSRHNRLLAPATRRNTEKTYRWLEPFKDRLLDTITKAEISTVIDGLPAGNAHIFLSRVRALFSYARSLEEMTKDPCVGLTTPATGEYRPWTQKEVDAFLKGSSDTVGMAVKLAYYTGQRMSDVLTMKWNDIRDGGLDVVQMKTKQPLHIPLHPKLKAALKKHSQGSKSDYIIAMKDGRPYTPHEFRGRFRDTRIALGLPDDMVFHGLRKLTAVNLAEKGASTQEIMAVGGWKSSRQVDHYCKGSNQRKLAKQAIGRLGAL
jgi:integrase